RVRLAGASVARLSCAASWGSGANPAPASGERERSVNERRRDDGMIRRLGPYAAETAPDVEEAEELDVALAPPWITILHNCDCHTFEDVVKQLIKAIACSEDRAWEIAWEVHNTGKAVVKVGPETECVRVGNILAATGLIVTVTQS